MESASDKSLCQSVLYNIAQRFSISNFVLMHFCGREIGEICPAARSAGTFSHWSSKDCNVVPRPLSSRLRRATFPKGEGFWPGGDHQIFEAVGARTARPAAQGRNLENLSCGKECRYPHPSRLRRATFPPGKVFGLAEINLLQRS
jgi:hypothetical protein